MHQSEQLRHAHRFDTGNPAAERGTRLVLWLTFATMFGEIAAGIAFNSMALLADGWHMATHALAIGLAALAYAAARRYANDSRFAFGTWKIEILASFASALLLVVVAAAMIWESVHHLIEASPIRFQEAMLVAVLGLLVNLVSALILARAGSHAGGCTHGHDLNLKSAYLHVVVDAATSVLAIVALAGGLWLGWNWLDPLMGLVGAALISVWAWGLLRESGRVLLDCEMDHPLVAALRVTLSSAPLLVGSEVSDLHVWRVGKNSFAAIVGIRTDDAGLDALGVHRLLAAHPEIAHLSVEISRRSAAVTPAADSAAR